MFLDRVIHFGGKLGDYEKDCSPDKLKSLIKVPYIANQKVEVVSFNMILISSPLHVPRPSCPFWGNLGEQVKAVQR